MLNGLRNTRKATLFVHAIAAHHGEIECKTIVACLVQAADAVSAARPGARRENIENYIKRLEQLEEISTSFDGVERAYAIQAGREVRVMVKPDVINDEKMPYIAHEIAKKIESEMEYPGQIKVNIIRESRASVSLNKFILKPTRTSASIFYLFFLTKRTILFKGERL